MKKPVRERSAGFYVSAASMLLAAAALAWFAAWAPKNNAMDRVIVISLGTGIALNALLLLTDIEFLAAGISAAFSTALFKLLSNSAGTFVDAFQGIVMFGDTTQLTVIFILAGLMLLAVLTNIAACFMGRTRRTA